MRRGSLAHARARAHAARLRERTGSARLTPESLPGRARAARRRDRRARGPPRRRHARAGAAARARGRPAAAAAQRGRDRPGLRAARLEWSFGGDGRRAGPLPLPGGMGVTGRVDRIDVGPADHALVRDYKNRTVAAGARWAQDGRLQVALYALAARELLGLEPAGALYQPLGAHATCARAGSVRDDVPGPLVDTDVDRTPRRSTPRSRTRARWPRRAAADLRAGRIRAVPGARARRGGCAYPAICRAGEGDGGGGVTGGRRAGAPACASPPSSARRSPTARARRCSPPTPAPARPR